MPAFGKRIVFFALLLCSAFAFSAASAAAGLSASGGLAVYSVSGESYLRASDGSADSLGRDEYIAVNIDLKNNGLSEAWCRDVHFRVDGGEPWRLMDFSLRAGAGTRCHIFHTNMQKLGPGSHWLEFYVNGSLLYSKGIYLSRNWREKMNYPSSGQIEAAARGGRSPYIVFYPQFSGVSGITEYAIDFSIDETEKGTYFSTLDAFMDVSSLQKKYKKVYNDYYTPGGFYCGFQQWDDGRTGVIMSVWDVICEDSRGKTSIICAKQLYPEVKEGVSRTSGEGRFQQFLREFPWKPRHPYRMLVQRSESAETGNAVLTMWVCDLENMQWTKLVSWDLGYKSKHIKADSLGGFMENYLTQYAGCVRNVTFYNIRGLNSKTGKWTAAKSVTFTVNNSVSKLNYNGSYNFGADDATFWIITSGVENLCRLPKSGKKFSVKYTATGAPY